jgi:thiamine biosynthesis protein ThiI
VTLSGDIYLKSRRTQRRLISRVRNNLGDALESLSVPVRIHRIGSHRYHVDVAVRDADLVVDRASHVFGVAAIDRVEPVAFSSFEELVDRAVAHNAARVAGRTFAVRAKRRGSHTWRSPDLIRAVGSGLVAAGGSVDLDAPEVTVSMSVIDEAAFVVTDRRRGVGGLPLGTQDPVLCLLSGGFDSAAAAWMLMSRGSPADFVHFSLNCAQSDHALAVATELFTRWGHGTQPTVHVVEFEAVEAALRSSVDAHLRQVTLKVLMAQAAGRIAEEEAIPALVTGDALGQVSSQTMPHLAAVSKATPVPILRPLVGMDKEGIIAIARRAGTAQLSARAREVCDLSDGMPVATAARDRQIARSLDRMPTDVMTDAVTTRKTFKLADWSPGLL